MKVLFSQCMDCDHGMECYSEDFSRCRKIESAGQGLGIRVKQKDNSYLRNIPFGVYMGLKHIVAKSNDPTYVDPDVNGFKYPRVDFVRRLSTETAMSQETASILVSEISMYGNINDAIKIYDENGLKALELYLAREKAKIRGVDVV